VKVERDSGEMTVTTTRSEAFLHESGHAVIFLVGISGFYLLSRVIRIKAQSEGNDEQVHMQYMNRVYKAA
jgi:hypothetical protein